MKARTLILTALTLVALSVPATGAARVLDRSDVSVKSAKITKAGKSTKTNTKITQSNKSKVDTHRRLCICIVPTGASTYVLPTIEEQQAAYDADLVAHSLDPVYSTSGLAAAES